MESWWDALPIFEKILWATALLFSALFVVQTLFSFIGGGDTDSFGDADGAVDADSGEGTSYFTLRNLIIFLTMFGWTGLACVHNGMSQGASIAIGVAAGAIMVAIMVWLMAKAAGMRHSGTLDLANAVGQTGTVYLVIPAARGGQGKVTVRVQGALRELDAITDESAPLTTGSLIHVASVIDGRLLLVTRSA